MSTENMPSAAQPSQRYQTAETAYVEVVGQIGMGKMIAKLKNLSLTGAFFELAKGDYMPKKGDILYTTIHLANVGKTHKLNAEVVWNQGLGFGVSFMSRDKLIDKMYKKNGPSSKS